MQIPPLDHAGWGRLLSAVMETESVSATPTRRERPVDETARIRRREQLERTVVLAGETDVYA